MRAALVALLVGLVALTFAALLGAADDQGAKTAPKDTASHEKPKPTDSAAPAKPVEAAKPAAPAKPVEKLPAVKGSHVADDSNVCFLCHTTADQWDPKDKKLYRFYLPVENLKKDVHYQKGVSCTDCHGGNSEASDVLGAHSQDSFFRSKQAEIIAARCAHCHEAEMIDLRKSVHATAGMTDNPKERTLLTCDKCHGPLAHSLLPLHLPPDAKSPIGKKNPDSPVELEKQVEMCGGCHSKSGGETTLANAFDAKETFLQSVHGQGLKKSGLSVGPVCADCHGAHGIYRAVDDRSTLNIASVADTCGKCHGGIKDKLLTSVHGQGGVLGGQAKHTAPGGKTTQLPSCTSCHVRHEIRKPESAEFRDSEPGNCGNCHGKMSSLYALSMHGKLTDLGYGPAAKCADCHGAHDILPLDNPDSKLSAANRVQTCAHCHANARGGFVNFDPHLDPYDAQRNPVVHGVQITLLTILFATFIFFGVHCVLWFIRGMIEVLWHGRARGLRPGATAYVRFVSFHRIGHTITMTSFLGLALTGLPLRYHDAWWAKYLARTLGGFESTGFWHRFFGVILLVSMLAYIARMARLMIQGRKQGRTFGKMVFGPDSPVPNGRDFKDFFKMLRWFFGLGPRPGMERWAYWEKVDFWGAIADTVIIGATGLVLWFPNFFCGTMRLPGSALNIAQVIHATQALLATGFVFAIHFFNTHFRPDKFPGDITVLTGLVSEEEFKDERPDYFQRLEREGKLEAMRTVSPGLAVLLCIRAFGLVALAIGLALLLGMVVAALG
jgi:cytochrome b subunit of formate dehydrogenase